jgi:diguanylate cyclase (GGDEF)-like protein
VNLAGLADWSDLAVLDRRGDTLVLHGLDQDGTPVLVKTHASELPSAASRERLRREHDAACAAQHPNLVRTVQFVDDPNRAALVLELAEGPTLGEALRIGAIDGDGLLRAGVEVARALASMHAAGVVHRAVDGEHVVLTTDGAVLVDLYDACATGIRPRRTTHGAHPAPEERAADLPPAAPAADQHALATTVRQGLAQLGLEEEGALRAALDRATSADTRQRFRSVLGLGDALEGVIEGETPPEDLVSLEWHDPTRLVGREALLEHVDAVVRTAAEDGIAQILLVRGPHGSGRSSVLATICDRLADQGVIAGLGRCGEGSNAPLRGPTEVMEQTVGQLLTRSDEQLAAVRHELAALGSDLPVVCEVLPSLRQLVGDQPAPPDAGPEETVARIERAVPAALRAITAGASPLVGAFDDLDRADTTTLRGLEVIYGSADLGPMVVVATLTQITDRLETVLGRLRSDGMRIDELELQPLTQEDVCRMVADGTGSAPSEVRSVADAVWARSGGNPQVALADVWALLAAGDLWPDADVRRWRWTPAAVVHEEPATVEAVAQARLQGLAPELAEVVTAVAAAGRAATPELLGELAGRSPAEVDALVARGVAAHVLAPPLVDVADGTGPRLTIACLDDGIRRAASRLLDDALEERVARAALATAPHDRDGLLAPADDVRYELVRLLADRPWVLADRALRAQLVVLCRDAARSAHRAGGFHEALALQRSAIAALGEAGWREDHPLAFEMHLRAAEHALMVGDTDLTDALLDDIGAHRPTPLERVRTMKTLGTQAWISQDHGRGLDGLCQTLTELGQPVPARPSPADIAREVAALQRVLGRTPPEHFLEAGPIEDPVVVAALDAMLGCVHLAYLDRPMLHVFLVLRGTRLTAEHGVTSASAYYLNAYGMLNLTVPGAMGRALRYGQVGDELGRRAGGQVETMVTFAYNSFVRHWGTDLDETIAPQIEQYRSALALGQRGYGFTGGTFAVLHALLASRPLAAVDELAGSLRAEMNRRGERGFAQRLDVVLQAVADLRSGSAPQPLDGEHFAAPAWLDAKPRKNDVAVTVHTLRAAHFLRIGELAEARRSVDATHRVARSAPGQAVLGVHWFQQAVLDAEGVVDADGAAERARRRAVAERSRRRLRRLAEHAPANAAHRLAYVEALLAEGLTRPASRGARAMERYDAAVALATEQGALDDLGLIAERAARFHAARSRRTLARHYATLARDAWAAWGATALADTVDERLPGLVLGHPASPLPDRAPGLAAPKTAAPAATPARPADEETFAEATRLLGEELEVRELLERLVEILVRHAEASRAFLVLESGSGPMVEVAASLADGVVDVVPLPAPEMDAHESLCAPAVHYALRTRTVLSLPEPAGDRRLRGDAALRRRAPRALLCLPIGRATGARGVLVLESDHAGHAFEAGRVEALRVLSEQAIAAIDRARLTSDLSSLAGDVAELRTTAAVLASQAETDPLTGVANRLGLEAQVGSSIQAAHADAADRRRPAEPDDPLQVGVIFCDLDGFKAVNDTHGHAAGDLVLAEVAERLRAAVRSDDIVARVGGDEFVVVSVGVTEDELHAVADRLVHELARPVVGADGTLPVTASIGVGRADLDHVTTTDDVDALVQLADEAMYRAKQAGKNRVDHG